VRVLLPLLVGADREGERIAGASRPLQGGGGSPCRIDGLGSHGSLGGLGGILVRELAVAYRVPPLADGPPLVGLVNGPDRRVVFELGRQARVGVMQADPLRELIDILSAADVPRRDAHRADGAAVLGVGGEKNSSAAFVTGSFVSRSFVSAEHAFVKA